MQPSLEPDTLSALTRVLSPERLATYLKAAGYDNDRALKLYIWNAQLGEAFHTPIQAVEVGLRNCVNTALAAQFGSAWWQESIFLGLADAERKADLDLVQRRIRNRRLQLDAGQVVAGLSLGFWVGMLHARYNPPLWGAQIRTAFPHLPSGLSRKVVHQRASAVATLRNRISHHEPLINRNISDDYAKIMELLGWICPVKQAWLRPHCRVPEIMRRKP